MGERSKEGFCVFAGVVGDEITQGNDGHLFRSFEPLYGKQSEEERLQGLMAARLGGSGL